MVDCLIDLLADEAIVLGPKPGQPGIASGDSLQQVGRQDGAFDTNASETVGLHRRLLTPSASRRRCREGPAVPELRCGVSSPSPCSIAVSECVHPAGSPRGL